MYNRFITTSIPYVNAAPHIGHALELVQADTIARYFRLTGAEVTFQTGTDENASKNVEAARKLGVPTERFVEENSARFRELATDLDTEPDIFIRTTSPRHRAGVELLWHRLREGDIYRRSYHAWYCSGCEDYLLPRDLIDGVCPDHLVEPVEVAEENYFFRLSKYQKPIEELISSNRLCIVPESRRAEVLSFVRSGLEDISVSRPSERTYGWGIPVPNDPSQVIYVWIDALINYLTGSGFGVGNAWRNRWNDATGKIHVIGKNVWKFHAVYWPALLLSAGLPLPNEVVVHGFLTAEGRKIGKSTGNAIDPFDEIVKVNAAAFRLYLLSLSTFSDGDYSTDSLIRFNDTQLASRLGSTVTRVAALCERSSIGALRFDSSPEVPAPFHEAMKSFRIDRALDLLFRIVDEVNGEIAEARPWERVTNTKTLARDLERWVRSVHAVGYWLRAFSPSGGDRICRALEADPIRKPGPIFPRVRSEP